MQDKSNITSSPTFQELLEHRISRRSFLSGALAFGSGALLSSNLKAASALVPVSGLESTLTFSEIAKTNDETHHVPPGYTTDIVIRWGDHLFDRQSFTPDDLKPQTQARQFGYNNDFLAYLPFTRGGDESNHGLLWANHEYTNRYLMFSGLTSEAEKAKINVAQALVEMEAHGGSVVEIAHTSNGWNYTPQSRYNRRITATTPMQFSGPAIAHKDLRTSYDPSGIRPLGTIGNCAGGVTPWGTILTCEENFDHHFGGEILPEYAERYKRYGMGTESYYHWHYADDRFDMSKEPNEPNRFGWVVEVDPYDPQSPPIKRTALGRFKHECATTVIAPDGRLVVYSGDDEMFEYVYRFVSHTKVDKENPAANRYVLDEGTLSVARFDANGTMTWLPLVYGKGGLDEKNGFGSQAEVLIYARKAADIVGATPMDRPEDVEVNPVTGSVFIALTMNTERTKINSANPRTENKYGHIIELLPPVIKGGHDHTAEKYKWEMFLKGGNPAEVEHQAMYQHPVSEHGWLTNPDNVAFDKAGHIWIATDGQAKTIGFCEGLYGADCTGAAKGLTKLFFTAPVGAEICGPAFTPDCKTLFLSIQHPAEKPDGSSFDAPATRWPDFDPAMPPRPSVIAITHKKGKVIGS